MNVVLRYCTLVIFVLFVSQGFGQQNPAMQTIHDPVPGLVKKMAIKSLRAMDSTAQMNLVIQLPLRNEEGLSDLIGQLYDPNSPNFHHFLSPQEFTSEFGPTQQDYQAVVDFAKAKGFKITGIHDDRMIVDVSGSVSIVQNVFHFRMFIYKHPTENREFFAPDAEPSIDFSTPMQTIWGLSDYEVMRPASIGGSSMASQMSSTGGGTGPSNTYWGYDFRKAYAPDVANTGKGQKLGIFALAGNYWQSDISSYEQQTLLPDVPLEIVFLDGLSQQNNPPQIGGANNEISLDIEMSISMAPGLDAVIIYEGLNPPDILSAMAADASVKQLSCSWTWSMPWSYELANYHPWFVKMQTQGQSFFICSGDWGAWMSSNAASSDDTCITIVGGTLLTTGTSGQWSSETAWNWSGGGVSLNWPIPSYQNDVNMSGNGGSGTMRNLPDVAMIAYPIWAISGSGQGSMHQGTSVSAPLWAGYAALVNQQLASMNSQPAGNINYAIYPIGLGSRYNTDFHDIMPPGNNNGFNAVKGYDLVTGWGSPEGQALINDFLAVWVGDPKTGTITINNAITIPAGVTLTITSGTNVVFGSSASLTVNGTLVSNVSVTVPSGVTLTASPNSTLNFAAGTNLVVNGALIANGATFNFGSAYLNTGGITINSNGSSLTSCTLSGAGEPLAINNVSGCTISGCTISNSNFNSSQAILVNNSSPTISNTTISGGSCSSNGIRYENGQGGTTHGLLCPGLW